MFKKVVSVQPVQPDMDISMPNLADISNTHLNSGSQLQPLGTEFLSMQYSDSLVSDHKNLIQVNQMQASETHRSNQPTQFSTQLNTTKTLTANSCYNSPDKKQAKYSPQKKMSTKKRQRLEMFLVEGKCESPNKNQQDWAKPAPLKPPILQPHEGDESTFANYLTQIHSSWVMVDSNDSVCEKSKGDNQVIANSTNQSIDLLSKMSSVLPNESLVDSQPDETDRGFLKQLPKVPYQETQIESNLLESKGINSEIEPSFLKDSRVVNNVAQKQPKLQKEQSLMENDMRSEISMNMLDIESSSQFSIEERGLF